MGAVDLLAKIQRREVHNILKQNKFWRKQRPNVSTKYRISGTIRRIMIFLLVILEKNNDECILILVIYWKKTGLVHTKISNHNIIYSS